MKFVRRWKHTTPMALGLGVVLMFLLHAAGVFEIPFVSRLEAIGYDVRLRLTMPRTVDPRIAIIDIDEKSLAEEGRWPWGRDKLAGLLDQLFDRHRAALVGFDVVFAEKDDSSGLKVLDRLGRQDLKDVAPYQDRLARLRPQLDHDRRFAQKLADRPVVLGYYFTSNENRVAGRLPAPALPAGTLDNAAAFIHATGYGANLPEFQDAARQAGHFNPQTDLDGVARRVPMLMAYRGAYYESLSLAMLRALAGNAALQPVVEDGALEALQVGKLTIPVDAHATALVPYRGGQGSFRYFSAADVLHGRVPAQELAGAIILVGTTAPGLMDLRSTPVGTVYPGVEVHANLLAGMLDNALKQQPGYLVGAELLEILLLGLALAVLLPRLSPGKATLAALCALVLALAGNLALWQYADIVMPVAATVLMVAALFVLGMAYGFFVEARAKRQITGLFGQYVPPELVDEMSENPGAYTLEGENREMTVLFSDVRGFTTISEGLSPQELSRLMNEYLTPMTHIIHQHRGTIDKYIGDAVMAFWGAPLADADHAKHAVLAALKMQDDLVPLREKFKAAGWPEIQIGVGLNTGVVSVGNMGSQFRMAYTVMGDAVNLASRLEGLTKQYGVGVLVGEQTRQVLADEFVFRELDRVRVKGKTEPVGIYEPVGRTGQVGEETLDELLRFQQALKAYRAQEWDRADRLLFALQNMGPRMVYALYLERIAEFRADPPEEDWDGVFVHKTK